MPSEAPDRVGSLVDGRYKITEVMAAGSMGSVYRAERVPVGKLVAVKFLHASYANDSEFQARFDRETRVMGKLNHPNCVSVVDFGVWEGEPYLVMDFVDGITLRSMIDKGPLEPANALSIARQILSGLAHAHAQDVFHRDVKPANVMISEEIGHGQRVRILDFGLARLQGNVGRDATQTNMVVGTPNYMAPEQTVPGGSVDGRTDLYAVGVVLYEMITGHRPFQAEDTLQLLGMHRAAPIPRITDNAPKGVELPKGTQELIDRAMAKSPEQRYQSAIDFAEAIDEVLQGKLDPTMQDITLEKADVPVPRKKQHTGALASTVLNIDSSSLAREESTMKRAAARFPTALFALLVVIGAGAALAGYLMKKRSGASAAKVTEAARDAGIVAVGAPDAVVGEHGSAVAHVTDAGALGSMPVIDSLTEVAGDAGVAILYDDAGLPIIGDPDVDIDEIDIDPENVEDPEGDGKAAPTDEEDDAPKSAAEVEKREPTTPAAPQLAKTIRGSVLLIKAGKKDLALASLRALEKKNPNSAYIPFLMGNLYFDRKWWSVALDHYRSAIKKNALYRRNQVLNRNVIRMLGSTKTRQRATNFLRGTIGKYAAPHLRWAAKHDENPVVRKQAATLARYIR
jgi:eukaryotic-like serine/threonine-protein kinase